MVGYTVSTFVQSTVVLQRLEHIWNHEKRCGLHILPGLRRVFFVLNHKYIEWKCFLGIFITVKPYI